ncbi:efflux RND transporter permease subunit [Sorangium sp. So ce1182]
MCRRSGGLCCLDGESVVPLATDREGGTLCPGACRRAPAARAQATRGLRERRQPGGGPRCAGGERRRQRRRRAADDVSCELRTERAASLTEACLRKPVVAWMLMAATVVFGLVAASRLGISQFPDVDFPTITISASLEGAAPEIMEHDVVEPIEEAAVQVEGDVGRW